MALCRWSDDDYLCDIYCYESHDGFEVHVASCRRAYKIELPPLPDNASIESRVKRSVYVTNLKEGTDYTLEPIGLPYDGASFVGLTADECLDCLALLHEAGYRFPYDQIVEEMVATTKDRDA